jgi:CheY-like chemotaxis protein
MRRVLVVDDDTDIRELTKLTLETVMGWDVLAASGGVEAVQVCQDEHPDAVLLDMMMPDMDGLTTFEKLQADDRTRDIPVILFTAKGSSGDRKPWQDHALRGLITKPYNPMTLGDEVCQILSWPTEG